ncbi:HAMP domain-containing sensor histidine kinase [Cellulomonas sp. NS3]|uniref:HAMP domain-containing sensor histidine kinase n=1 Tax=Cellulomonas sp. NS3 TaxID=2973977 RepID=UPI002162DC53|nr:HAMP domain-containing sensor histidine kinase [Cellulomonas sp. NS3]
MRPLLVRYGLAMTSVVLVAFLVPLAVLARGLAEQRALEQGRADAQRVAVFAGGATQDDARLEAAVLANDAGAHPTTVFRPDGTTLGDPRPRTAAVDLAASGQAFTARADGGVDVLLPVAGADGTTVVRTHVPDEELRAGVTEAWLVLAGVGLVLLGGTALAGDRLARRVSSSVRELSGVAQRLGGGDLEARVEPSGPPEVAAVGRVLNGLGARVAGLLAAERELVADLSHRLRTPVTALRLDVDLLPDPEERARLTAHVDHLVEAVDDLVRTAREPAASRADARCDAAQVVRERARFWAVLAAAQSRELTVDVPDAVLDVGVAATDLGAALDVLVDNVLTHTPERTPLALAVLPGTLVRVVVEDAGPGLGPGDVERGRSGAGSTGLGLDVARRTAEQAGGRLVVDRGSLGGARVTLELPAA